MQWLTGRALSLPRSSTKVQDGDRGPVHCAAALAPWALSPSQGQSGVGPFFPPPVLLDLHNVSVWCKATLVTVARKLSLSGLRNALQNGSSAAHSTRRGPRRGRQGSPEVHRWQVREVAESKDGKPLRRTESKGRDTSSLAGAGEFMFNIAARGDGTLGNEQAVRGSVAPALVGVVLPRGVWKRGSC